MLRLKSCPRCKGDLRIDQDHYGWYEECIQCGYICDLPRVVTTQEQNPEKTEKPQFGDTKRS